MFGKKKKTQQTKADQPQKPSVDIETIPDAFYGGQNPIVYQKTSAPLPSATAKTKKQPVLAAKVPLRPSGQSFFQKKSVLITGGVVFFVLVVAGISWYYIRQAGQTIPRLTQERQTTESPTTSVEIPIAVPEETPSDIETATPTTTEEIPDTAPTTTPSLEDQPIEFPTTLLVDSEDLDEDALTDMEESFFNTDVGIPDTDEDGYTDGLEVVNLYNPAGIAPRRIIDSGLVREYINPAFQYRLYYPMDWEVGVVDSGFRQVLFSSATGDFVEIRVVEKEQNATFIDWFAEYARGQRFLDFGQFTNRFEEDSYKRNDSLVGFFVKERVVYAIVYHPGTTGDIPFRHVMEMIIQSFRPDQTFVELPEQAALPEAPATSTEPAQATTIQN
jgi:hypothetical protein